jgi:hypothetical protein
VFLFDNPNLLVAALYDAFYRHYPLKPNPNVIWLTFLQGFGKYVNKNAEAARDKLVSYDGKVPIAVVHQMSSTEGRRMTDWVLFHNLQMGLKNGRIQRFANCWNPLSQILRRRISSAHTLH